MSKKRRKKSKTVTEQPVNQELKEKHPQNRKWTYVILIEVIIATIAVIWIGKVFFGGARDNKNSVVDHTTVVDTHKDHSVPGSTQGSSIHFPEPSHDFGTISQGSKVSHTFIVKNTGTEPLKLKRAYGS